MRGPAGTVHLKPKMMSVLVYLAEHAGQVVERPALARAVWGAEASASPAVRHYISELRHELKDPVENPRYIKTIPAIGYQLIPPVRPAEEEPFGSRDRDSEQAGSRPRPSSKGGFWHELKRRRVVRVALVYAIAAWGLMQAAELIFEALKLPEWTVTLVVVLLILGFPLAVILAWALQVTPQGIVAEPGWRDDGSGTRPSSDRRLDFVVIGGLVAALAALSLTYLFDAEPGTGPTQASTKSIGVLPFENLGDDIDDEYLSDGVAEDIRTRLAKIAELAVAARTSSMTFKDSDLDIPTIGARLGVAHVLEGTLRRSGDRIRVTAQLIDARNGFHTWAETYDRDRSDIFAVQDDIARAVVNELKLRLSPDSPALAPQRPTHSVDAYELYLEALAYRNRKDQEPAIDHAIRLFERALERDPRFAHAYAGLCNVHLRKYELTKEARSIDAARDACGKALEIDDSLSESHVAHGNLLEETGEHEAAIESYRRAIEFDASSVDAYSGLARSYGHLDRLDKAEETFIRAVNLRPGNWDAYSQLAEFQFHHGRFEEAVENYRKVTELNPEYATGFNDLGAAYMMLGEFQGAAHAFEHSVKLSPAGYGYSNLGTLYYYRGDFDRAVDMYQKALLFQARNYLVWGNLADVYQHMAGQEALADAAYRSAIEHAEEALAVNPADPLALAALAYFYVNTGALAPAREKIALALEHGANNVYVYYFSSLINLELGNESQALDDLEQAVALGFPRALVVSAPEFEKLEDTSRFRTILSAKEG